VVWVRLGNCTTDDVESVPHQRHPDVLAFERDRDEAFLVLAREGGLDLP